MAIISRRNHMKIYVILITVALVGASGLAWAAEKPAETAWPKIPVLTVDESKAPAFKEAEEAVKGFKIPKGLQIKPFAVEPQLVSPVAISVDEKGKVYVIETFRAWGNGGVDMRHFPQWLDEDLAA